MGDIVNSKRVLNPLDRAEEILFGLIMALTFTCSISIAHSKVAEVRHLLIGAIGCNLAWGITGATMYLIGVLAQRNRNKAIFDYVQKSSDTEKANAFISENLPPVIASVINREEFDNLRQRLVRLPDQLGKKKLTGDDIRKAIAIFLLNTISTLPLIIPFIFIKDTSVALRTSNLVAIVMMFVCGWSVARYVGSNKWIMSMAMVIIGIILVAVTIALGG